MTINEAMVLQKAIRERVNDLTGIRDSNLVSKKTWDYTPEGRDKQRVEIEVKYDPKLVDKKISELRAFLFKVDAAIKKANAKAEIGFEADVDKLLEPIA